MSSTVVVDTDVVSYLFKSHPTAFQYLPDLTDRTPMISFMTLAELDRWVLEAHWGETRRRRLREYLERFVVLPYDRDLGAKRGQTHFSLPRSSGDDTLSEAPTGSES